MTLGNGRSWPKVETDRKKEKNKNSIFLKIYFIETPLASFFLSLSLSLSLSHPYRGVGVHDDSIKSKQAGWLANLVQVILRKKFQK